jgi:hypothetical protein
MKKHLDEYLVNKVNKSRVILWEVVASIITNNPLIAGGGGKQGLPLADSFGKNHAIGNTVIGFMGFSKASEFFPCWTIFIHFIKVFGFMVCTDLENIKGHDVANSRSIFWRA